jgi:UDP-N-acetylmuramoyl-tripeptide--D-alanyl-D-alanine ligase
VIAPGRFGYWLRQQAFGPVVRLMGPLLYGTAWLWRRLMVRTTFVAVTGALGKTTTKELLADILASHGRVFRTWRNQNATSSVALNVLRVRPWHRYAVLEVATAAPGIMQRSARLVRPDAAVVLNVLATHTTAFATLDEHAVEKAELLRWVRPGGLAVLNVDDPYVRAMADACAVRVVRAGRGEDCDYRAADVEARWPERLGFTLRHGDASLRVATQLVGTHWQPAALAAIAAAHALGVPLAQAVDAALRTPPFPGRLQPVALPGGEIVLRDDYNASIDTIETSMRVLAEAPAARRMLVITDLSDFGRNRKQRLKYLAGLAARSVDALVIVGENAAYGRRRAIENGLAEDQVHAFDLLRDAALFLRGALRPGDLVLLKGRTTDHAARVFFAQLGESGCWKEHCPKRMLCDICWELDVTPAQLRLAVPVPPPSPRGRPRA